MLVLVPQRQRQEEGFALLPAMCGGKQWSSYIFRFGQRFLPLNTPARTRARRLQQGLFEGACSDLRSSLAAGTSSGDEARALLLEAEAGAAMASCPDPEAKGRGDTQD